MSRKGIVLFAAMCVIWSIPYLLIRIAVRELDPTTVIVGRTAIASVILVPIALARGQLRAIITNWKWIAVFAAVEIGLPWFLMNRAEEHLTSSITAILVALVPLVTVVLYRFSSAHEPLTLKRSLGLVLGASGVVVLVGLDFSRVSIPALCEMVVVAICYSTGPLIMSTRLSHVPHGAVPAAAFTMVTVAYALPGVHHLPSHVSAEVIWSVVVLGVVCSALAFLVFFPLVEEVGPARSTVVTYLNPAIAVLLGVAILGEPLTAGLLIGFPIILGGSVLASLRTTHVAPEAS